LSGGNARSAAIADFTKNEAIPRPTPNSFLNDSFRRSRSAMTAVMSTSLKVVSIAAVCCASTSRRAIVWRRFDMRTRSSVRALGASLLLVGATLLLGGAIWSFVGATGLLVGAAVGVIAF
jgi:hypothetical protein